MDVQIGTKCEKWDQIERDPNGFQFGPKERVKFEYTTALANTHLLNKIMIVTNVWTARLKLLLLSSISPGYSKPSDNIFSSKQFDSK